MKKVEDFAVPSGQTVQPPFPIFSFGYGIEGKSFLRFPRDIAGKRHGDPVINNLASASDTANIERQTVVLHHELFA